MNFPLFYFDTSLYLGLLLGEEIARPALKYIREKTACSSILLLIEAERNIVRCVREGSLSEKSYTVAVNCLRADKETFFFRDVTADICLTGRFPPARLPRASDLVHLRTALWFQRNYSLEGFLTLDSSQKTAALDLGLPVIIF
jgi:hypothetical protein